MVKPWSRNARERTLEVRAGSTVKRDVYKAATAGLTGVTAFGALAVTGAVAGTAAHQKAVADAAKANQPAPPPAARVVAKRRVHRTVLRTRVVHVVSSAGVARPTTGGTVSTSRPSTVSHSSSSGGSSGTTHSAPKPAAPAPAPSSGS